MRKLFIVLITLLLFTNLKAQHPDKVIIFLLTDFETNYPDNGLGGWLTDSVNPWIIDETNPENIWQIGKPYKAAFDTAYSVPNAIMTDTLNPYPINNHSTFEYLLTKPDWAQDRCFSALKLYFMHKFETDMLSDGGYIQISYDKGNIWTNVLNDNSASSVTFQNFYNSDDTIKGGENAFSGLYTDEWLYSGVEWCWYNDDKALELDSLIIRFSFFSDGIDNSKAGWIIDNIYFLIEDYCTIGINDIENDIETFIYPNPVSDISILELPDNDSNYYVQIFNIQGKEVFSCISRNSIEINRNYFNTGIYFYKINNAENKTFTGKFIVK